MTTNNTKGAKVEKELLRMLEARQPLWPYDDAIDAAYVRKLYALYGAELNLVEKFFLWESYYSGKPARERTNPRLAFHKWCINGVALKKKYAASAEPARSENRKPAQQRPMLERPGGREAGNAAPAVAGINVNDLAAGIAAAKAAANPTRSLPVPLRWIPARIGHLLPGLLERGGAGGVRSVSPQPTQEELEARRQDQLRKAREVLEKKTDG